jgi:hypothetical protein
MKFYIPPAVAVALLVAFLAPRHHGLRIGGGHVDKAKLDAAELFVHPGMTALQGMDLKSLRACFRSSGSRAKFVDAEQGDDGATLSVRIASGKTMLLHFRFFDDHRFALLDTVVTPEGLHVDDPGQLWGMANSIILGNCAGKDGQ